MNATLSLALESPIVFPLVAPHPTPTRGYSAELARTALQVLEAQRLRYRIFAEEKGAALDGSEGLDVDHFDRFCRHLLVRDGAGRLIGTTRLLTQDAARRAGGFYSETEFEMDALLRRGGRFLEIGRTCIDAGHRNGAAISTLWSGIGALIETRYDRLIGCASIDVDGGFGGVHTLVDGILERHQIVAAQRVTPKVPLPGASAVAEPCPAPPLLKAYLRLGAQIGGPAYYDADFRCADLLVVLRREDLAQRYARHFLSVRT
jgi:putative hemolysin